MTKTSHKIRPAARIIKTIGQDLIKDVYAAIVELVKNAYDADSESVVITFSYYENQKRLSISVADKGHGMSFDTIVNSWLVPATSDKLIRRESENGRTLQGRKGIGRFAAAVLGEHILLESVENGKASSLLLDMDELDNVQYLDEFQLDVEVANSKKDNGTTIEVERNNVTRAEVLQLWTSKQVNNLLVELRGLLAPQDVFNAASKHGHEVPNDTFNIKLNFNEFPLKEFANSSTEIVPFPVLDLYDYRIFGSVDARGNAKIEYENQNTPNIINEKIELTFPFGANESLAYPGDVYIDIRVYDRDPANIDNIIKRGLKDPLTGEFVGKLQARKLLNEYFGVGVYREQFRIRPYGEQSFDWLDLDKDRVQNPSRRIGHNQTMGFVFIREEEKSSLYEKSARDGLVENSQYYGLKALVSQFINQLESRRVEFREKTEKGRIKKTIDQDIDDLFNFEQFSRNLKKELDSIDIPSKHKTKIDDAVNEVLKTEENRKSPVAIRIKDSLAVYEGQATLGRITHILLHEGRKHIKYISETVPRVANWSKDLVGSKETELTKKLVDRSEKVVTHSKGISRLFKKIEPFARTRRLPAKDLNIVAAINNSFDIYESDLIEQAIVYEVIVECEKPIVKANELDLLTVFSNLVENSIYWHSVAENASKFIQVKIVTSGQILIIKYIDNGPGFQGDNLERMFEPGYSMKVGENATGLGLALAGEAMYRSGGDIEAIESENGAVFHMTFGKVKS